jgi:soluble cytochrome b562
MYLINGENKMDNVDKYLNEGKIEESSKVYKSLADRIKRAKSAKDISKVLQDVKKAVSQKEMDQKEAIKIADMADDALEEL